MLIAFAGLPATGKSAIARQLAARVPAILLDKDTIRAALFPPNEIEYSVEQDDLCVRIMYQVVEYLLRKDPHKHVILDGRTFSKRYQVAELVDVAKRIGVPLKIIECTASDHVAKQRLDRDAVQNRHLARNRDFDLYLKLKAQAEPITVPKLVINTDSNDVAEYVRVAVAYIQQDI
jgi:predicted kinase